MRLLAALVASSAFGILVASLVGARAATTEELLAPFLGATLGTFAVISYAVAVYRPAGGDDSPGLLPPLPLAMTAGMWLYLIVGPVASILDPSYLLFPGAARHYGDAYLYAGVAIAAYAAGAWILRSHQAHGFVDPAGGRGAQLRLLLFLALLGFVWLVRAYLGELGRFSGHRTAASDLSGAPMYAYYATLHLRWAIIPWSELYRSRTRGVLRFAFSTVSALEVLIYIVSSERTMLLLAAAQLALARGYFSRWGLRRVATLSLAAVAVFFIVLNPVIYVSRRAIDAGEVQSGNQISAYSTLLVRSVDETLKERREDVVGSSLERDVKYRINSLYYIAAMIGSDRRGTCEHGWGEYTFRSAASFVPAFLWPEKRSFAISNAKFEITSRLGIPTTDYVQTLAAHYYSDFGWLGLVLMLLTGSFDQAVSRTLLRRRAGLAALLFYFVLLPSMLAPIGDFYDHFLGRFRETLPFFGLLALIRGRLPVAEGAATPAPRSSVSEDPPVALARPGSSGHAL